ncbi:MAG: hypothetical protein LBB60_11030 [Desulfovibrio sp.]|jgi:G3E family GTPase|nr:hypothetical protein [Desulfovibrio sp.]
MTTVILIGGFLGAGKTTLMRRAAAFFAARGKKVGVITNDQSTEMVDTKIFSQENIPVKEVSGSCFCCNFNGLTESLHSLRTQISAEVIVAESVGSCTDLSATIAQPLKEKCRQDFTLAPMNVVLDPARLRQVFPGLSLPSLAGGDSVSRLHESAAYIARKQMEEADILLVNKKDALSAEDTETVLRLLKKEYPQARVLSISALNGDGVEDWLETLRQDCSGNPGNKLARVDYDIYAEGEAVLGWLNALVTLKADDETTGWRHFCEIFMQRLGQTFQEKNADIGHVKIMLFAQNNRQSLTANCVQTGTKAALSGEAPPAAEVELLVNARVEMPPETLQDIVESRLKEVCRTLRLRHSIRAIKSLSPGRPRPTWRYDRVIGQKTGVRGAV